MPKKRKYVRPFRDWPAILAAGVAIVHSYTTTSVTLRQLFYRLVVQALLDNTLKAYKALSDHTAIARRAGTFPDLIDRTRTIHVYPNWSSPAAARDWLTTVYRRDRTEGQPWAIYLGIEKAGLVALFEEWFGDRGIPILPLGGYHSVSFEQAVVAHRDMSGRPSVLLYAGDFDPSGEDIVRNFLRHTSGWTTVERVALTPAQVTEYGLPEMVGKKTDTRAKGFETTHGRLVQVELDALEPPTLRALFEIALAPYWDDAAYQRVLTREARERRTLAEKKNVH